MFDYDMRHKNGSRPVRNSTYIDEKGLRPFEEWLLTLDKKAQIRVDARFKRIVVGNFRDYAPAGEGVYEFRLFSSSGYRIYYAIMYWVKR